MNTLASTELRMQELRQKQSELEAQILSSVQSSQQASVLQEHDEIKRKYKSSMNRYFDAMNYKPTHHTVKRENSKLVVEPFSFEQREATRTKRIVERKFESELQRKQKEEEELLTKSFTANPVPPSTYLEKYSWMVKDWEMRRDHMHQKAVEKATRMKIEEEESKVGVPIPHAIPTLGTTTVHTHRSTTSQRRSASADWRTKPEPFKANPVPKFADDEKTRQEKEKQRAEKIKLRADWLLAISHAPSRMEDAEKQKLTTGKTSAVRSSTPQPVSQANFTFHPKINHDTPDFAVEWSSWQNKLLQSKNKTKGKGGNKTASSAERSSSASMHHYMKPKIEEHRMIKLRREADANPVDTRWPRSLSHSPNRSLRSKTPTREGRHTKLKSPKPTKAHAARAQTTLNLLSGRAEAAQHDREERKARIERDKRVSQRIRPYVDDLCTKSEHIIKQKTRENRANMQDRTLTYENKIREMVKKVSERPPIFSEPSHYYDEASRRAAAELTHQDVLKNHGIDLSVVVAPKYATGLPVSQAGSSYATGGGLPTGAGVTTTTSTTSVVVANTTTDAQPPATTTTTTTDHLNHSSSSSSSSTSSKKSS